jgi:hypothetical protein
MPTSESTCHFAAGGGCLPRVVPIRGVSARLATTTFYENLVMSKSARDAGCPTSIRLDQREETRAHLLEIILASILLTQEEVRRVNQKAISTLQSLVYLQLKQLLRHRDLLGIRPTYHYSAYLVEEYRKIS